MGAITIMIKYALENKLIIMKAVIVQEKKTKIVRTRKMIVMMKMHVMAIIMEMMVILMKA